MIRHVTVRNVLEYNNCAGKKFINITSMEEDEIAASQFLLSPKWMPPHYKLALSTVSPLDKVGVIHSGFHGMLPNPHLAGEYVENYTNIFNREPRCLCKTPLVSDGFDLYCPNNFCGLTLVSKIHRLGNTQFFDFEVLDHDPRTGEVYLSGNFGRGSSYSHPFFLITQGMFWGNAAGSLEHILLEKYTDPLSLANFLIPDLFRELVEKLSPTDVLDNIAYSHVQRFYETVDQIINERNYESTQQQRFVKSFIWCLGIESLLEEHVDKMMVYEASVGAEQEPFLTYAYLLASPEIMVSQLHIHRLEAVAIANEVKRRSHEIFDIFYHYTNDSHDVVELFNNYMR